MFPILIPINAISLLIKTLFLFRERVCQPKHEGDESTNDVERRGAASVATTLDSPPNRSENGNHNPQNGHSKPNQSARSLLKSASISASKCIGVQKRQTEDDDELIHEVNDEVVDELSQRVAGL